MNKLLAARREYREQLAHQKFLPFYRPTAHRFLPFDRACNMVLLGSHMRLFAQLTRLNTADEFFLKHPVLEERFIGFCKGLIKGEIDLDQAEFRRTLRAR